MRRYRLPSSWFFSTSIVIAILLSMGACSNTPPIDATVGCSAPSEKIEIRGRENILTPDSVKAKAGCIEITFINDGTQHHALLIKGAPDFFLEVDDTGDSDVGTIELKAGTYDLYCNVSGHEAAGMKATLVVT